MRSLRLVVLVMTLAVAGACEGKGNSISSPSPISTGSPVTVTANTSTIIVGGQVSLTASGGDGKNYTWSAVGGRVSPNAETGKATFTAETAGVATVKVVSGGTIAEKTIEVMGLEKSSVVILDVYPGDGDLACGNTVRVLVAHNIVDSFNQDGLIAVLGYLSTDGVNTILMGNYGVDPDGRVGTVVIPLMVSSWDCRDMITSHVIVTLVFLPKGGSGGKPISPFAVSAPFPRRYHHFPR